MKIERQKEISDQQPRKHFGRSLPNLSKSAVSWFILACSGSCGMALLPGSGASGDPMILGQKCVFCRCRSTSKWCTIVCVMLQRFL
jgi:hypothetical protein